MSKVVTEAREWIGTPYRHQHSTKGVGCDCLGLVRGVYRGIIGPEPEQTPNYSPSWGEAGMQEVLLGAAQRNLVDKSSSDKSMPLSPGDVLIFRMRRGMLAKHCGIAVSNTRMIHAYQGSGAVEESDLVPYWRQRIIGVFRYPGE